MKNVEVSLFDGFILTYGTLPHLGYLLGLVPVRTTRVYILAPKFIKHEFYGMLLDSIGIRERHAKNLCNNEDCFAAHGVKYKPHTGLCKKHSKIIDAVRGKIRMRIANTMFCHSLREEKLKRELYVWEEEFGVQTGTEIEEISFSRNDRKIKDGDWFLLDENGYELLTDAQLHERNLAPNPRTCKFASIRPCRDPYEFEYHMKNKSFGELMTQTARSLMPFKSTSELSLGEIVKSLPQMTLDEIICSLETHEHTSRLTHNEITQTYKINENGREFLKAWSYIIKHERGLEELKRLVAAAK